MSWNYSGNPQDSCIDECRFILGDINQDEPIMQDEEIQYLLDAYGNNTNHLYYQLFKQASVLFARDIKRSLGPQTEDPTGRLKFFNEQTTYYKRLAFSGGISIPNYSHPKTFKRGMHNNPPYTD